MIKDFEGKKLHYVKSIAIKKNCDIFEKNQYSEKKIFEKSWNYKRYLQKKRIEDLKEYLDILRNKLEYEMKTLNRIDEIDYQEFLAKYKIYMQLISKNK